MSIHAMTWAFSLQQLDPHKKIVLLSLADNANDEGYCWPSMETIAKKSSMSKSTARRHIKSLETLGLLTKQNRVKIINHEKHTMEVSYAQRTAATSENDSFRQRLEDTDW